LDDLSEWVRVGASAGGVQAISAHYATHVFPNHAHAEYVLGAVTTGAKATRLGNRTVVAGAGQMMLLNPFEEHSTRAAGGPWTWTGLYLTPEAVRGWMERPGYGFDRPLTEDPAAARLLVAAQRANDAGAGPLAVQDLLVALLDRLGGEAPVTRACVDGAIRLARERLEEAEDLDLVGLAGLVGLPPVVLLRRFRAAVGCTPHIYRTSRRLARAKTRLRAGAAISEVALETGFCDQSHLTRTFSRWIGVTPGAFAQGSGAG
jgi:AraC-like DNA-binding protein